MYILNKNSSILGKTESIISEVNGGCLSLSYVYFPLFVSISHTKHWFTSSHQVKLTISISRFTFSELVNQERKQIPSFSFYLLINLKEVFCLGLVRCVDMVCFCIDLSVYLLLKEEKKKISRFVVYFCLNLDTWRRKNNLAQLPCLYLMLKVSTCF